MTWTAKRYKAFAASTLFATLVVLGGGFSEHRSTGILLLGPVLWLWWFTLGCVHRVEVFPDGRVEMTAPLRTRRLLATEITRIFGSAKGPYIVRTDKGRMRLSRGLEPSAFSLFEELHRQNPALRVDV